jgi:TatD DNase family protein
MKSLFEKLNKPNFLFDSHCHLNDEIYDGDRDEVVKRALETGVEQIWDISVDLKSSERAVENAKKYENVKAVVGVDPEAFIKGSELFVGIDVDEKWFEKIYEDLDKLILENRNFVIAIGESGLDAYWNQINVGKGELSSAESEKSLELQERLFKVHLELAQKYDLPVSIHSRNAETKCLEIVKNYDVTGIFHSYTGNYETAKKVLDAGWNLGVNVIITFKNANELREIYKKLLGSHSPRHAWRQTGGEMAEGQWGDTDPGNFYQKGIYLETDGPYLSPDGKRGERNEPGNVKDIYDKFIEII